MSPEIKNQNSFLAEAAILHTSIDNEFKNLLEYIILTRFVIHFLLLRNALDDYIILNLYFKVFLYTNCIVFVSTLGGEARRAALGFFENFQFSL